MAGCKRPCGERPRAASGAAPAGAGGTPPLLGGPLTGSDHKSVKPAAILSWPKSKLGPAITKRDYAAYLAAVSPHLLPHLKDRPITLIRLPGGLRAQRFYQRHWNFNPPPFVETVDLFSEHRKEDGTYILCNNLASLLWFAQIANLDLHAWLSSTNPPSLTPTIRQTI